MYKRKVYISNPIGLHGKPATIFVQKANEFKSNIWIDEGTRRINAKSLLGILSIGINAGTTIKVISEGADEKNAVDTLVELIESRFE